MCVSRMVGGHRRFVTSHHMPVVEINSMVIGTIVSREGSTTQTYSQFMQGKIMDEDLL